jgi:hypothetical protein
MRRCVWAWARTGVPVWRLCATGLENDLIGQATAQSGIHIKNTEEGSRVAVLVQT